MHKSPPTPPMTPWNYTHCLPMFISGLDPSIPSWTIWASHPSGLHPWNSGEEDNHCLLDNDLLRASCGSYSFVIIRVRKKNKIWPHLSNRVVEQTCQQITQIRVISATVHVWAGLSRGIKKRPQGVPNAWALSPALMPISFREAMK